MAPSAGGQRRCDHPLPPTSDTTLLTVNKPWPATVDEILLADPVQQWWDLRELGGEDRHEAADRLRRAIISKSIAAAG